MKIIFLGPPGSGKGTQAKLIEQKFNIRFVSVGDIIRNEIKNSTLLGLKIKDIQNNGYLISDDIIIDMVKNIIIDEKNLILDGFPRTLNQAKFLLAMKINIDIIININVEDEIIIKRLKYRLINKKSHKSYNLIYNKPKIKNKDDITGGFLTLRADDKYLTILKRLKIYKNTIDNIIFLLKEVGKIKQININGTNNIIDIFNEIEKILYEKNIRI